MAAGRRSITTLGQEAIHDAADAEAAGTKTRQCLYYRLQNDRVCSVDELIGDQGYHLISKLIEQGRTPYMERLVLHADPTVTHVGFFALTRSLVFRSSLTSLKLDGLFMFGYSGAFLLSCVLQCNTPLEILELIGTNIGDSGLAILGCGLKLNKRLKTLRLDNNNISHVGICALSSALGNNSTLTDLSLNRNHIGPAGFCYLTGALACNQSILRLYLNDTNPQKLGIIALVQHLDNPSTTVPSLLHLNNNNIGDQNFEVFPIALYTNRSLKELSLQGNNLTSASIEVLADALIFNTHLNELILCSNLIDDHGAVCLSAALLRNRHLTEIDLLSNFITDVGAVAFSKSLRINSTLSHLHLDYNSGITNRAAESFIHTLSRYNSSLIVLSHHKTAIEPDVSARLKMFISINLRDFDATTDWDLVLSKPIVSFADTYVSTDGLPFLVSALSLNTTVVTLNLCSLESNRTVENIFYGDNSGHPLLPLKGLQQALEHNQSIKHIYICNEVLGNEGAQHLAGIILQNTRLQVLQLHNVDLGDSGSTYISRALASNYTIRSFECYGDTSLLSDPAQMMLISRYLRRNYAAAIDYPLYSPFFVSTYELSKNITYRLSMGEKKSEIALLPQALSDFEADSSKPTRSLLSLKYSQITNTPPVDQHDPEAVYEDLLLRSAMYRSATSDTARFKIPLPVCDPRAGPSQEGLRPPVPAASGGGAGHSGSGGRSGASHHQTPPHSASNSPSIGPGMAGRKASATPAASAAAAPSPGGTSVVSGAAPAGSASGPADRLRGTSLQHDPVIDQLLAPDSPTTSGYPRQYICPISGKFMTDPVVAADGHIYDSVSISEWLDYQCIVSPITLQVLPHVELSPSAALQARLREWQYRRLSHLAPLEE
ncbi:hypothetical protein H696_03193 [Fonticula alba]|uniref:U-box domain-containing protein n=1 Tax=Fonticula alba TaxID=691883 RepID=A0A058Z9P3_FONAL|nr:hypothetical protein H696_03193 [Fonticula alba]KCV70836.1 hypothetical protein H696_03193 [Fonticula alba]|eukprot:XP_009495352.1 hypothetical protein H696_03193 [Fonticula alba]